MQPEKVAVAWVLLVLLGLLLGLLVVVLAFGVARHLRRQRPRRDARNREMSLGNDERDAPTDWRRSSKDGEDDG